MTNLQEIQQQMQAYVLENDIAVCKHIAKSDKLDVNDRLDVYRNGYHQRLLKILSDDYPVLLKTMGEERFSSMVHHYLQVHPSNTFTIREVGEHVADFFTEQEGVTPFFVELAKFEWAVHKALYAHDVPTLSLHSLANLSEDSWMGLILYFHPSLQNLRCRYNVFDYWRAADGGSEPIKMRELVLPSMNLIWRNGQDVHYCQLSPEQTHLFDAIVRGESFATLCQTMLQYFDEEEVATWVAAVLRSWLSEDMFQCLP